MLLAELEQHLRASAAELGLERTGRVVNAGVDDAAVMAGLMPADLGFLLEDHEVETWSLLQELARGGQADNAGANHHDVMGHAPTLRPHPALPQKRRHIKIDRQCPHTRQTPTSC